MTGVAELLRFEAFGSGAVVAVTNPARLASAWSAVDDVVKEFDRSCSRFRADSELSALNGAGETAMRVSALLLEAVTAALRAARLTDGDVDPTVGGAMIALGYDRDFAELGDARGCDCAATDAAVDARSRPAPRVLTSVPGWRTVQVDPGAGTIRLARGVWLDLGATGKALAADRAAERAGQATGCGVLVSFGGDISVAGAPPAEGWRIRVTDDHRSNLDAPGQWISIRSGGLATSSTAVRRWRTRSGSAHHLVDPATAQPACSTWRTASVAAASCLDANIATTAAIIRGERAVSWLETLGLPSRLVRVDGTVCHIGGWPSEGDDLLAHVDGVDAA